MMATTKTAPPSPRYNAHRSVVIDYPPVNVKTVSRFQHLWAWLLLAIVALGDAMNFWIVIQLANSDLTNWMAALLVAAMTAGAVVLMHFAGTALRDIKAGRAAHGRGPAFLAIVVWLVLGFGAFILRLKMAKSDGGDDLFGAASGTDENAFNMALLLLALYLAGGVIAYLIGFRLHNPNRQLALQQRTEMRRLERRRAKLMKRRARNTAKVEQFDRDIAAKTEMLRAAGEELKQTARLQLSEGLRGPGSTTQLFNQSK